MFTPRDYQGARFGLLTVHEPIGKARDKTTLWRVTCDCGTELERSSGVLARCEKAGNKQSCGCHLYVQLDTGKKYGHLTPIERRGRVKGLGFNWLFRCDCGSSFEKIGSQVARGQGALHCGCAERRGGNNKNDLRGQVFGKLTVLDMDSPTARGQSVWYCRCECGNELRVKGYYLRRGKGHCGCDKVVGPRQHSYKGYGGIYRSYWTSTQNGAKLRGLNFEISIEFAAKLFEHQEGKCALSGVDISLKRPGQTASLDRKNSLKGYTEENVQWVHKSVNLMKWDLGEDEFIELCRRVAANWPRAS